MIFTIQRLKLSAIIGQYDHERKTKQDVFLNIQYEMDVSKASHSDEIGDTLNYHELVKEITKLVEESRFNLIEKLADYVAGIVMNRKSIRWTEVEIQKPGALPAGDYISVKCRKDR